MKMLKHQDLQHYFLSSFLLETLMRRGDLHCIIYSRVLTQNFLGIPGDDETMLSHS